MNNTPFSLRIDASTRTKLKREAKQSRRSESYVAQEAIKSYLETSEQKRKAVNTALKQAQKGKFISSKSMHAWVDSWGTKKEIAPPDEDIALK